MGGSQAVKHDEVTANSGGSASIQNAAAGGAVSDDTATADHGGVANVANAGDSSASATGASSQAVVGSPGVAGSYITGSSAVNNNGTTTTVTTNNTHAVNGMGPLFESVSQLQNQGLSHGQAELVYAAEQSGGTAVEVSYDGRIVVEKNQASGSSNEATATSGARTNDIAAAVGGGSDSSAKGAGAVAFADGANPDGNNVDATATGKNAR